MAAPLKAGLSVLHTRIQHIHLHKWQQRSLQVFPRALLHCICFAWERNRHWNGEMMLELFRRLFAFPIWVPLVRESISRGSQQWPVRASLHQQVGCLRYYSPLQCLDFFQLVHPIHSARGGVGPPSSPAVPSSDSQFWEEVIHLLIDTKLLCHSEGACCWEGRRRAN